MTLLFVSYYAIDYGSTPSSADQKKVQKLEVTVSHTYPSTAAPVINFVALRIANIKGRIETMKALGFSNDDPVLRGLLHELLQEQEVEMADLRAQDLQQQQQQQMPESTSSFIATPQNVLF